MTERGRIPRHRILRRGSCRWGEQHGNCNEEEIMRTLTDHIIPGDYGASIITCDDGDASNGGCSHHYVVSRRGVESRLDFQHGPVGVTGVNGLQDTDLMVALIDRFRAFQAGPFACDANAVVLVSLQAALEANMQRTRDRVARQVEGTLAE